MVGCPERHITDSPHKLNESWITAQIRPQGLSIDEKPDDLFDLHSLPAGEQRTNDNICLMRIAMQQRFESREQRNEQSHPLSPAQLFQPIGQLSVQGDKFRRAAI